jgi:xanthine dehydrogenase YagT iron-sulfur-binding subunit
VELLMNNPITLERTQIPPGKSADADGVPTAYPSTQDPPAITPPAGAFRTIVIHLTINGAAHALTVDPRQSLLDVLRENLDLTGTKKGCNQGACGACTVLVNERRVLSCLTLACMQEGATVTTIEGLADGDQLHPLQAAFIEHEGFQCGYCTAGQIMSGVACIAEGHAGSHEEIHFWMSGNICRCGAYLGIVDAVADAAAAKKGQ